jgi:hypothetical protein
MRILWSSKRYERMDSRFRGNDNGAVETIRQETGRRIPAKNPPTNVNRTRRGGGGGIPPDWA